MAEKIESKQSYVGMESKFEVWNICLDSKKMDTWIYSNNKFALVVEKGICVFPKLDLLMAGEHVESSNHRYCTVENDNIDSTLHKVEVSNLFFTNITQSYMRLGQ